MKKLFIAVICMSLIMIGGNAFAAEATADAGANANLSQDSHAVSNVYDRQFVNPGVTPFPQTNGFFTSPTPDSSFRSMKEFINLFGKDDVVVKMSDGAIDNLAKGGSDTEVNFQVINEESIVHRAYGKDYKGTKFIYITLQRPSGVKLVAMVDGEADDNDTNSMMVLGQMAQEVLDEGCNVLVLTAEGAHRGVDASGWGIGAYATGGLVNDSGKESMSSGVGTGYASNRSMTEDMPWLQGYAGVDDSKPELAKDNTMKDAPVEYAQLSDRINGKGGSH
jgi:hypothetical protein